MTKQRRNLSGEEGFTLVYMAAGLTTFLLFTGLALYVTYARKKADQPVPATAAAQGMRS